MKLTSFEHMCFPALILGIALWLVSTLPVVGGEKKVRVNLGTIAPRGSTYERALQSMAQRWKTVSGGRVRVVVLPDGTAGNEIRAGSRNEGVESVTAMRKRGLQVHAVSPENEAAWQKMVESSLWPQIRGSLVPEETFDKVENIVRFFGRFPRSPDKGIEGIPIEPAEFFQCRGAGGVFLPSCRADHGPSRGIKTHPARTR